MNRSWRHALLTLLPLTLAACSGAQDPRVSDARVTLPPPGMAMSAGYFQIDNPGREPLDLRAIDSSAFDAVEMHETVIEDGVSKMRELDHVTIPAGGTIRFEPGGRHLMMFGIKVDLDQQTSVPMTLQLAAPDGNVRQLPVQFHVGSGGGD